MNYLKQLQAFRNWQMINDKLSTGQIALWHTLMAVNNMAGWLEWFTAANLTLEQLTGLSKDGILKARNKLKQFDLIDFRTNGQKATSYKVRRLYDIESRRLSTQDSLQDSTQVSTQDSLQDSTPLYKQNKTKQNKTINNNTNADDEVENQPDQFNSKSPINHWQEIYISLNTVQLQDLHEATAKFGDDIVNEAIDRTARAVDVSNRGGAFKYLSSILKSWSDAGVKTLADIEKADKAFEDKKAVKRQTRQSYYSKPKTTEIATDWSKKNAKEPTMTEEERNNLLVELDMKLDDIDSRHQAGAENGSRSGK